MEDKVVQGPNGYTTYRCCNGRMQAVNWTRYENEKERDYLHRRARERGEAIQKE